MPAIPGSVRVTGFLAPSDSADTYAVTDDAYHRGGFRPVASEAARDLITEGRRKVGMLVYCIAEDKYYQCTVATTPPTWVEAAFGGGETREGVCELVTAARTVLPADNRLFLESDAVGSAVTPISMTIDQAQFVLLDDEGWQITFKVGMNDDGDPVPVFAACSTSEMSIDDATFIQTLYSAQLGDYLIVRYAYAGARRGRFLVVGGKGTWTDDFGGIHVFGSSGAINVDTTMYVDGTDGDDGDDGLTWGTAKKTFGFLIGTATDALPKEINAAFTCYFRNDIRARDADGHFLIRGFYGSGSMTFIGTLTAVETLTATTYENDGAVRHGRIWVNDATKAWTPGQYRRHFIKVGADPNYYPIYANTETKLYFPVGASLTGTPACTIYSAPELLEELESDPGVKYNFGTWPGIFFGVRSCVVQVDVSNLWLDEVASWYDSTNLMDSPRINLTNIAMSCSLTTNVGFLNYTGCYFDLWDYRYNIDEYTSAWVWSCVIDSTDNTGWGYNPWEHSNAFFSNTIFVNQVAGIYVWDYGIANLLGDVVFRYCEVGVLFGGSTLSFIGGYLLGVDLRFDTVTTCMEANGTVILRDGHETAVWDVGSEIVIGETDYAEFSEVTTGTLQSRVGFSVFTMDVDTTLIFKDEYDNTTSGLTAVRYQTAIDEIVAAGGSGVNLATFGVLAVDLIDDTDFTAVEVAPYVTEATGYIVEVTPSTGTGNLTVILYDDASRLNVVHTLVIDLSDATTFRSAEAFGMDLETTGTIYGTAFVSGVAPGETFDLEVRAIGLQPSAPPAPLPSPYGQGIEDDGLGKPRIALSTSSGLDFDGGDNLVIIPDVTAPVTIALGLGGASVTGAVTTTTDEVVSAKKLFTAVGASRLASSGPPTTGTYLTDHEILDSNGIKWRCTSDGTPGDWMLVDSVADPVLDYVTGSLTAGSSEVLEIITTGDIGFFQHIRVWGVVDDPDNYTTEFRVRVYETSSILGREMVWQGVGAAHQSYLTAILPAATLDCTVDNEDMFETDEACVVYASVGRYELARIASRAAATLSFDEVLVDASSWAADTLVCSVAQFDMVPFRNTDGTPANRGRVFLQIRNDHESNEAIFYVQVMPLCTGVTGNSVS